MDIQQFICCRLYQCNDAAFNLPVLPKSFFVNGVEVKTGIELPVTTFDDGKQYWYDKSPDSGLIIPNLGLKISVTSTSLDGSIGQIQIRK